MEATNASMLYEREDDSNSSVSYSKNSVNLQGKYK